MIGDNNVKLRSECQMAMFSFVWIIGIVIFGAAAEFNPIPGQYGYRPNTTTCEEFELGARLSPYTLVDSMWKVFYFWSNNTELYPIYFSLPAKKSIQRIKEVFEVINPGIEVEWEKSALIMEPRPGIEILLLYAGTPGAFRALIKQERRSKVRPHPQPWTSFADVRMKQVDRVLGIMCCEDLTAFALIRVDELPTTEEECVAAASKLRYHSPEGRSYLSFTKKDKIDNEL